jgi:hypothetical protein
MRAILIGLAVLFGTGCDDGLPGTRPGDNAYRVSGDSTAYICYTVGSDGAFTPDRQALPRSTVVPADPEPRKLSLQARTLYDTGRVNGSIRRPQRVLAQWYGTGPSGTAFVTAFP